MKQSTNLFLSLIGSAALLTGCSSEPKPTAEEQKAIDSISKVYTPAITEAFNDAKVSYVSTKVASNAETIVAQKESEINKENQDIRLKVFYESSMFRTYPKGVEASVEINKKTFPFYSRQFN